MKPRTPGSSQAWFGTRYGRRYGREIAAILVVKLLLLLMLWAVFVEPWSSSPPVPVSKVVHRIFAPQSGAERSP